MRAVSGLTFAERFEGWPSGIPKPRPRGVKALGARYERAVARALPGAEHGVWWRYADSHGPGICQTDLVLIGEAWAVVLECKHSWTLEGMEQLKWLYLPVVAWATGRLTVGVQVCKNLTTFTRGEICQTLEEAIAVAKAAEGRRATLHWRGLGPLLRASPAAHKGGLPSAIAPVQSCDS